LFPYLNKIKENDIQDLLNNAAEKRFFDYPWTGLEDHIKNEYGDYIELFAYGSLINKNSAKRTLAVDFNLKEHAAIGLGAKRIFNYEMRNYTEKTYGPLKTKNHISVLNTKVTYLPEHFLNGIIYRIHLSEIDNFRLREKGYALKPIIAFNWNAKSLQSKYVFILEGKKSKVPVLPHIGYYNVCRKGAKSISEDFLEFFLNTTYLYNEKTKVKTWEDSLNKQNGE